MSKSHTDKAGEIRAGEELDLLKLQDYITQHLPQFSGELTLKQFPSGHSNLTYSLQIGEHDFVLRRPPFGAEHIKKGHDMGREYRILNGLSKAFNQIPRPIAYCEDNSFLGTPFYLMERVQGLILRSHLPSGLGVTEQELKKLSNATVDTLVKIHNIDLEATGLIEMGRPTGYVKRQIEGWTGRYHKSSTDDIPEIEMIAKWLAQEMPTESGIAMLHNDYKYDNLVLNPSDLSEIRAVLDWEMATVGDPLMDLGTSLGYWIDPNDPDEIHMLPFALTAKPGNLSREEFVQRYAMKSGKDLSNVLYYYVFGIFKIAVICQQIYYRFKKGFTQDPRFAFLGAIVEMLGKSGKRAIQRNSL